MKTNVRTSSIDSYYSPDSLSRFNNQHKEILEVFHNNLNRDYTRKEVSRITGLDTCTVSGRIYELIHAHGALEELIEKRICSISNKNVLVVRLPKLPAVQRELFLKAA